MKLSEKIYYCRKKAGMSQEALAARIGVSRQAVSKWENDLTAPDISLIPKLAELFHITTDELLGVPKRTVTAVDPAKVDMSKMLLRMRVLSSDGDKVNITLPLALAELVLGSGQGSVNLFSSDKGGDAMKNIDWKQIIALVKQGAVGRRLEVQSAAGDTVEIWVE